MQPPSLILRYSGKEGSGLKTERPKILKMAS